MLFINDNNPKNLNLKKRAISQSQLIEPRLNVFAAVVTSSAWPRNCDVKSVEAVVVHDLLHLLRASASVKRNDYCKWPHCASTLA